MIRFSMAHWITKRTAIRHAWRNNRADSGSPSGVNCQQHLDSEPVECLFRVRSLSDLYRETLWTLRRKSATWCTNRGNIWHRLYAAIMMGVVRCKMQDKRTVQAATFVLERTANYRKNKTHCIVQWSSVVSLRHCNTDIYIYIYIGVNNAYVPCLFTCLRLEYINPVVKQFVGCQKVWTKYSGIGRRIVWYTCANVS